MLADWYAREYETPGFNRVENRAALAASVAFDLQLPAAIVLHASTTPSWSSCAGQRKSPTGGGCSTGSAKGEAISARSRLTCFGSVTLPSRARIGVGWPLLCLLFYLLRLALVSSSSFIVSGSRRLSLHADRAFDRALIIRLPSNTN